jgi:hypothetical protein
MADCLAVRLEGHFLDIFKSVTKDARLPGRLPEIDHLVNFSRFACIKCTISMGFDRLPIQGLTLDQAKFDPYLCDSCPDL